MGAYTEALDFLAEIGASDKVAVQTRLHVAMAHPRLGMGAVSAPAVPGPLQAPAALLGYSLLPAGARGRRAVRSRVRALLASARHRHPERGARRGGGGAVRRRAAARVLRGRE